MVLVETVTTQLCVTVYKLAQLKNFSATTETVEVLKGPASVLYGIQDPGGVVNIITKETTTNATLCRWRNLR